MFRPKQAVSPRAKAVGFLENVLRNHRLQNSSLIKPLIDLWPLTANGEYAWILKRWVDALLPTDPLRRESPPTIEVLVVAHPKDFSLLPLALAGVRANCANPISEISVVTPGSSIGELEPKSLGIKAVAEEALLPNAVIQAIKEVLPEPRLGWAVQQAVKLAFCRSSESNGVLVLDADTILTRKRQFLASDSNQLLLLSREFERQYEAHAYRVWGKRKHLKNFSFVTHHQLMQPWIVNEMFPRAESISDWIIKSNSSHNSPLSEYHSYGRWIATNHWKLVELATWSNKSLSNLPGNWGTEEALNLLSARFPQAMSISLHSYNRGARRNQSGSNQH